jgi:hypothetical protein
MRRAHTAGPSGEPSRNLPPGQRMGQREIPGRKEARMDVVAKR